LPQIDRCSGHCGPEYRLRPERHCVERGRLAQVPPAPIAEFRAGGADLVGAVENADVVRTAKARAARRRRVTERGEQQPVEAAGLRRHRRLAFVQQTFERLLLVERVDEDHRRRQVLRLDRPPQLEAGGARLRGDRARCPGT